MAYVTVLIPTYNCSQYLLECIGSVLRQSYQDFEILIIDDGSIDNTEHLIKSINNNKIRYYKTERNLGIVSALNQGIDLAKGNYIARMDADDIMIGNRLHDQINFLENHPDYGMVGGDFQVMDESGKFREMIESHRNSKFLSLALIFRNQFHHATVTMRTSIAKELRYDRDFQFCEDHDLWIRFSHRTKVGNLPGCYLSYRWYKNNSSIKHQDLLRINIVRLLSRELSRIGVVHSASELMLHASVSFGLAATILSESKNVAKLASFYDRIFSSEILNQNYGAEWLKWFKQEIISLYCCGFKVQNVPLSNRNKTNQVLPRDTSAIL